MAADHGRLDLTAAELQLIRLARKIQFGSILELHVRDGQPVFNPLPHIHVRVDHGRPARTAPNGGGELKERMRDVLLMIRAVHNGLIHEIVVRDGLPAWSVADVNWLLEGDGT